MELDPILFYDYYLVFPSGTIYSLLTNWWVPYYRNSGYLECYLHHPEKGLWCIKVHRVVAMCFCPKTSERNHVNHIDGNKENNDYRNLEWCTPYENNRHARDHGLNDISAANRRRWRDPEKRRIQSEKLREIRLHDGRPTGVNNPQCQFVYRYAGNEYSLNQLIKMLHIHPESASFLARELRSGIRNKLSEMGVEFAYQKGLSTIEKQ